MKVVHYDKPGPPEVLKIIEGNVPKFNEHEILINVKCAGVNRPDLIQREGNYPPPPKHSNILGLEVSGIIEKKGKKVKKFKIGDKVAALVDGGGYAEYCCANEKQTFMIPKNISFQEAAGIPECFFTSWSNLIDRGRLKKNQKVLIHGGTSGIGLAAIQILKQFNTDIFVTVGNEEKLSFCKKIGVQNVVNYKEHDFFEYIKKKKDFDGLDIILDIVGGDYVMKNINLLKNEGKLINIGFQKGSNVELNLIKVMLKRLTITGSTLRIRDSDFKYNILKALSNNIFPHFENNKIKCYIDSVFKFKDVVKAHQRLYEGKHIGKVILDVGI